MKLHFKLNELADDTDRRKLFLKLADAGASRVAPMFRDATDPELGSLFALRCAKPRANQLESVLERSEIVEFFDPPVQRTLKTRRSRV